MPVGGPRFIRRPKRALKGARRRVASIKPRAELLATAWTQDRAIERADRAVAKAARGSAPILVGPWLSEIGFEVLYWIPMLNRFVEHYGIERERLVAVSRGGAQPWYADLAGSYVDAFDFFEPEQLRERHAAQKAAGSGEKVWELGGLDAEIVRRTTEHLGLDAVNVLHPGLMNQRFRYFWARSRKLGALEKRTLYRPLPAPSGPPPAPGLEDLPEDYVAVKAYFSADFPDTEENRAFVRRLVARLAEEHDVVLLSTGLDFDGHADYAPAGASGAVHDLAPIMVARHNLDLQTRVIAGARALFTTYGGFAYLGPLLGVDTVSFYSLYNFSPSHLDVARRIVPRIGSARLAALDVRELDLLDMVSGLERAGV